MKSPRATKINPACGQRPWGEVLFRRRPRSRRSSNEVAPSAGGRRRGARSSIAVVANRRFWAGACESCSESSPVFACRAAPAFRREVASAVIGRSLPSFGLRILQSSSRFVESPASAVPLGTPTGGGRKAELSPRRVCSRPVNRNAVPRSQRGQNLASRGCARRRGWLRGVRPLGAVFRAECRCRSAREGWAFLQSSRRLRPAFSRPSGCRSALEGWNFLRRMASKTPSPP